MGSKEHVPSRVALASPSFFVASCPKLPLNQQVSGSESIDMACGEISLLFFAVGILYLLLVFFAIQVPQDAIQKSISLDILGAKMKAHHEKNKERARISRFPAKNLCPNQCFEVTGRFDPQQRTSNSSLAQTNRFFKVGGWQWWRLF